MSRNPKKPDPTPENSEAKADESERQEFVIPEWDLQLTKEAEKKGNKMLVLSAVNDISDVAKLHQQWKEHLAAPLLVIDARAVERMDTSVLQLLTALIQEADKNQVEVKWEGASAEMKRVVKLLGLNGPMKLH